MKVGLLGAGFMGHMHAFCYARMPDVQLALISDVSLESAIDIATHYGGRATTDSTEPFISPDIDFVDICLPSYLHREYVVKAADAGKHVLCEKPIALSMEDANVMIKATKAAGVKFMVAHVVRFWPEYLQLKHIYDRKTLGKLQTLTMTRLSSYPMWAKNPRDYQHHGGAMLDLHIHDVDFLLFMLGKPRSVFAQGNWDHIISTFGYSGSPVVTAEGGFLPTASFPFQMAFRATFANGVIEYNSCRSPTLCIYRQGVRNPEYPELKPELEIKTDAGGNIDTPWPYYSEIRYFVDCLRDDKEFKVCNGETARESLEVISYEKCSLEEKDKIGIERAQECTEG